MLDPGLAFGEGVIDFEIAGLGFAGMPVDAFGEDVAFDGAGALEPPTILGDELDEIGFLDAGGREFGAIGLAVGAEGDGFLGRVDVDRAAEAVFERVEADAALAGVGAGSGGEFGVGAVGGELRCGHE